jgi:hypothetical protein
MAKALFGHVGVSPEMRMLSELRQLRERCRSLEHEVARLEAANAALRQGLTVDDDMLTLSVPDGLAGSEDMAEQPEPEPALA